jgi:hypothetical protein
LAKAEPIHEKRKRPLVRKIFYRDLVVKDSVAERKVVVSLEGLGAKRARLAVNRQW